MRPTARTPSITVDLANACVWRGQRRVALRPKDLAVLRALAAQPGQLVPTAVLLEAGWPETYVNDEVVRDSIRRLRRVLGERATAPRWIETVPRQGYRLRQALPLPPGGRHDADGPGAGRAAPPWLVGREAVLGQLHGWLAQVRQGQRRVGLVTGEVGMGKTTVVDAFVADLAVHHALTVVQGQCVAQYGAGEAYLPVFAALTQGCRGGQGARWRAVLRQYAPTWLQHMPGVVPHGERAALQRQAGSTTPERMRRELAEAVEVLAAESPVVVVLEDLHWSDVATLDLLSVLGQRRQPACLLLLGTARSEEAQARGHPLHAVLPTWRRLPQVAEIPLTLLTVEEVGAYLAGRFPDHALPAALAQKLYARTEGNPLFLVTLVDQLVTAEVVGQAGSTWRVRQDWEAALTVVPTTLAQVIGQRRAWCSAVEQEVLAVASVAGLTWSAAAVAAGLEADLLATDARCAGLAQRGLFLEAQGESVWPDGTVAGQYGFRHALYQQVLYEQVPAAQRVQWHRRIAHRVEAGYGAHAGEMAAHLAVHCARGRDFPRAVRYCQQAATNAMHRYAYAEAITHCQQGLALLQTLPETPDRHRQELALLLSLHPALAMTQGDAHLEVHQVDSRARDLCQLLEDHTHLFQVLQYLAAYYRVRGALHQAAEVEEQLLTLAQAHHDPVSLFLAHKALGTNAYFRGAGTKARAHLEQAMALCDTYQRHYQAGRYTGDRDLDITCRAFAALTLGMLGYPDQARTAMQQALAQAQALAHPFSLAWTLHNASKLYQLYQEAATVHAFATTVITISTEQGFTSRVHQGQIMQGWALVAQGQGAAAVTQMQQGVDAYHAMDGGVAVPYFLALLAEAYRHMGQPMAGLATVTRALQLADMTGARFHEAELHRLKGELLLAQPSYGPYALEAEACFAQALEVARQQQAKAWELRAALSLARLWQCQSQRAQARQLLVEVYGWFTEGFDTADLQAAKALLKQLA